MSEKIAVVGLGYVGLPLLKLLSHSKNEVIGIDIDEEKINKIKKLLVKSKVTNDFSNIYECNIVIICVPTPAENGKLNTEFFKNAIIDIGKYLSNKALIINESTLGIGMTRKYVTQIMNKKYNKIINTDYYLACCPERIDPLNNKYNIKNINRVCGASSDEALEKTYNFYKSIINAKIMKMKSIEECELVKCWENSIRNISIAESNLLAQICDDYKFDVKKVIEGLNTKVEQFELKIAYPGLGPGGHCIPEDIHYLIDTIEYNTNVNMDLFKEAIKVNETMPQYIFNKLEKLKVNKNVNLLFLGISYKANSDDLRHSQALKLLNLLKQKYNDIKVYDPLVNNKITNILNDLELNNELEKADIVILGCPHDKLKNIKFEDYKNIKIILDCWNVLDREKLVKSGKKYIGVGE